MPISVKHKKGACKVLCTGPRFQFMYQGITNMAAAPVKTKNSNNGNSHGRSSMSPSKGSSGSSSMAASLFCGMLRLKMRDVLSEESDESLCAFV